MTDTPTREDVEAMVKRERPFQCPECKSTLRVGYDLIHRVDCTARGDLARLAAAYLALLDRHEEALALLSDDDVICSLRELADRDRSHSGHADPGKPLRELSDRIEEFLRRVGGEE